MSFHLKGTHEVVTKGGGLTQLLGEHKESGFAALVREFYANMVEEKGKKM